MCCRRRNRNGHYRGPIAVVLGKMAYGKYQERQAKKIAARNQPLPAFSDPEVRSSLANDEVVEKASINPPSYEDIVVNRAIVPNTEMKPDEKAFDWTEAKNVTDDIARSLEEEHMYGFANGMNHSYVPMNAPVPQRGGCHSRCQQKKAAKCGRKAGYRAPMAAAGELRM